MSSLLLLLLPLLLLLQHVPLASSAPESLMRQKRSVLKTQVCYAVVGCFSSGGHFRDLLRRPIDVLPQSPASIGATFTLYTRSNKLNGQAIVHNATDTVRNSHFNAQRPTKVVVHGFLANSESDWMHDMKNSLLLRGDFNVLLIDWSGGNQPPYSLAASNTRVVGAQLGLLLLWLERQFGASLERAHVLGHSLGGHIAGYAGTTTGGRLGRITGMDPAGPYFDGTHIEVRLDPTDAKFVDVIHTDGGSLWSSVALEGGFGLMQPLGHVDFYPNGGKKQPGCGKSLLHKLVKGVTEGAEWVISCDHGRVMDLVTSTANNAGADFKAVPCDSYEDFKAGKCASCGDDGCAAMGFDADQWQPKPGRTNVKMFLDTTAAKPFELHNYVVNVKVSGSSKRQYGDLYVTLRNGKGNTSPKLQVLSESYMDPGKGVGAAVGSSAAVYDVDKVELSWRHRWWLAWTTQWLRVDKVEVFEAFTGKSSTYCANAASIASGKSLTLQKSTGC